MDQSTLVDDKVFDGRRFVQRFAADGNPVDAAFWAKAEESGWFLYVATELTDRLGPAPTYRAVNSSLDKIGESWVRGSDIKVVSPKSPIAKKMLALVAECPERPQNLLGLIMDNEHVYFYPRSLYTMPHQKSMTTDEIERGILGLMHHAGDKNRNWAQIKLKDGTGFEGIPLSLQVTEETGLEARFIVNDNGRPPRVIPVRLDAIASIC